MGLVMSPTKRYFGVLTPSTSKCDLIQKQSLCRCNQDKAIGQALVQYDLCSYKTGKFGHRHTGRAPCENEGREKQDVSTVQGTPKTGRKSPAAGRGMEQTLPYDSQKAPTSEPLLQGSWPPELSKNPSLLFKAPGGTLSEQPWGIRWTAHLETKTPDRQLQGSRQFCTWTFPDEMIPGLKAICQEKKARIRAIFIQMFLVFFPPLALSGIEQS